MKYTPKKNQLKILITSDSDFFRVKNVKTDFISFQHRGIIHYKKEFSITKDRSMNKSRFWRIVLSSPIISLAASTPPSPLQQTSPLSLCKVSECLDKKHPYACVDLVLQLKKTVHDAQEKSLPSALQEFDQFTTWAEKHKNISETSLLYSSTIIVHAYRLLVHAENKTPLKPEKIAPYKTFLEKAIPAIPLQTIVDEAKMIILTIDGDYQLHKKISRELEKQLTCIKLLTQAHLFDNHLTKDSCQAFRLALGVLQACLKNNAQAESVHSVINSITKRWL